MSWIKSHALMVILGLPILGITLGTLYYISRKDKEWEEYISKLNQFEKEILVPMNVVPSVIGRCGANIKDIQSKTQTKINFKEFNQNEKTCCIRGARDNVLKAESIILEHIARWKLVVSYEMWIPKRARPRVIGRCGENIRLICKASNASVNVTNTTAEEKDEILVVINGTQEQIAKAKTLVEDKIAEDDLARNRIVSSPRRSTKAEAAQIEEDKRDNPSLGDVNSGTPLQVYISSIANPSRFWLQLVSPKAADLDNLTSEMTEYYNENSDAYKLRSKPALKQIVAFESAEHNSWYRGLITDIVLKDGEEPGDDTEVDVFNVDFGESNYIRYGDLRELRTDFLSLEFQAIEASLDDTVPPNDDFWVDSTIDYFQDLVNPGKWTSITAQVVRYDKRKNMFNEDVSVPCVRLYLPQSDPGVDVATHLIRQGLAVRASKNEEEGNQKTFNQTS